MNQILATVNICLGIVFGLCYLYQFIYIFIAYCTKQKPLPEPTPHKIAILIAARNESAVIPNLIDSLKNQDYPKELYGADLCIAHVWAGNDSIHPEEYLPKMEKAADLFSLFAAKQYFFAHLYEIGRQQSVMWDTDHADLLGKKIRERIPAAKTKTPLLGHGYRLFDSEER
jgi:cellulose synthase/poly-beta-1,6-N-acetylglucosamine synthase-like glycosyltransferase